MRDSNIVTVDAADRCTFTFTIGDEFCKSLNSDKAWMKEKFLEQIDNLACKDFIESSEFKNLQLLLASKFIENARYSINSPDIKKDEKIEALRSFFEIKLNRKMTTIDFPFVSVSNFTISFVDFTSALIRMQTSSQDKGGVLI